MRYARALFKRALRKYAKDTDQQFRSRSLVRAAVWEKTGGRCWYCGKACNPFIEFSIDHLKPRVTGGNLSFENLVPCCRKCNSRKRDASLEDLRAILAREDATEGIRFTDEQIAFLESQDIFLFANAETAYRFYFELLEEEEERDC